MPDVLSIRLTPEQREIVAAKAADAGLPLSAWARAVLLSDGTESADLSTERPVEHPDSAPNRDEVLALLLKIGRRGDVRALKILEEITRPAAGPAQEAPKPSASPLDELAARRRRSG